MDAQLKELGKLDKLVSGSSSSKGKTPSIEHSLDALFHSLQEAKNRLQTGNASLETFSDLVTRVDSAKKDIDDRQKEIHSSLARFGKGLDKVRGSLPGVPFV